MKRTKLVYVLGRDEKELLAYDEYNGEGSGKWFTDNLIMANEEAAKWKNKHAMDRQFNPCHQKPMYVIINHARK
jgi:hypothetical protein